MQLGKFEILEELGRGGFGIVYKANDLSLGREVALKVLHPQLAADLDFVERFRREARLLARLEHSNIVPIYEFDEIEGRLFIAMRYLSGGSLSTKINQQGALPADKVLSVIQQVSDGLSFAHQQGMIHCDIKPNNILFDAFGNALITDFGLTRAVQSSASASTSMLMGSAGTPNYMSPEMWEEKTLTAAVDQYSLACVIYEMLIGKKLFDGDTTPVVMMKHFKPINLPETLPGGIRSVLHKALEKDAGSRFDSLDTMQWALEQSARQITQKPSLPEIKSKLPEFETGNDSPVEAELRQETGKKTSQEMLPKSVKMKSMPAWLPWVVIGALGLMVVGLFIGQNRRPPMQTPKVPTSTATKDPIDTASPSLGIGSSTTRPKDGMKMVYVPAGEFSMGSNDGDSDENPVHTVYLDPYWIDKYEVTNRQYAKCVEAGDCSEPSRSSSSSYNLPIYYGNSKFTDYPVIYVSWYQADAYCQWAGGRLPSEAEWEKAARGVNGRIYPWGDSSPDKLRANYDWNESDTTKVGSYPGGISPYGAMDIAGNVMEWVADRYDSEYYYRSPLENPRGPDTGDYWVLRGGSWSNYGENLRTFIRFKSKPIYSYNVYGFRCATTE